MKEAEKKQPQREGRALQAQVWRSSTNTVRLEETIVLRDGLAIGSQKVLRNSLKCPSAPDAGVWLASDSREQTGDRIVLGYFHILNLLSLKVGLSSSCL